MVTRRKKKYLFLPPSQAFRRSPPDRQQRAHPPRPPRSDLQLVQVSRASTLALRLRPHPGIKVKGEGLLAPLEPSDPMAKFQAGLRPARLLQALALRHLRGPPWFAPCPTRPGRGGPWTVPTWSLLTSCGHGSGSGSQSLERRETRQGVGRKISPKRTPVHRRPPWGGGSRGRLPQDTWMPGDAAATGTPPSGRGNADS